jgi:exonuclease III
LGVTESKLNSTTLDSEVRINGYFGIWRDRTSGAGGGVIVFVRDDLNFQRPTDLELFVKYSKSILVCFTYRPPNSSEHLNKNFHEVFNNMVMTALQENKEVILLGDLNSDYSKPTDNSPKRYYKDKRS